MVTFLFPFFKSLQNIEPGDCSSAPRIFENEIFEFEEAAQIDPEQKQLNNCFPEFNKKQILPRLTLYRFTLTIQV